MSRSTGTLRARRLSLLAMAGLAIALAAGAEEPNAVPQVARLRFEGVRSVAVSDLRDAILTTAPDWRPWREDPFFDEEDLREDLDRINAFYRDRGYFDTQSHYELEWNDDRDRVWIEIHLDEGEPVRLASWQLEGADGAAILPEILRDLRAELPAEGSVFGVHGYRQTRSALLLAMANRAHPSASLEGGADIDPEEHAARVEWVLDPGPLVSLGEVKIVGLEKVEPHIVLRELAFDLGDPYSQDRLLESERRIFNTGLFRSVSIEPERIDESDAGTQVWPLLVRVSESAQRSFRVGVGYGTEDFFRGQAAWTHRNFLGNGRRLRASGKASALIAGGEVELIQPYFFGRPIQASLSGSVVRDDPPAYKAIRYIESLKFEKAVSRHWTVRWGQGFEWADVRSQNDAFDGSAPPRSPHVSTLPFGVRRSTLDNLIEPHRGTWLDIGIEPSLEIIGSDMGYVKAVAEARGFLPAGPTVFGMRLRGGVLQPTFGSDRADIPVFKRFFAGGSTSVRGFNYQKLGPLDDDGDPVGGLSLVEGSIEWRFPIWKRLFGVLFSDAGDVQRAPFDWKPNEIEYSSGVGLRLKTPVGPLRIDVARLYDPPHGIGRYAFYISVGHAF